MIGFDVSWCGCINCFSWNVRDIDSIIGHTRKIQYLAYISISTEPNFVAELKSQKQKYIKQGNIKVAAEYANSIGNLYCEIGMYH